MLLSKSCIYGLRASLFLAGKQNSKYISIGEMSDKLDISFPFLTKVLQQLTAAGLLESLKGPNGGVRLTSQGYKSTLIEFVTAIDGEELFTQCALGLPGCGIKKPCPLHDKWSKTKEDIREMLEHAVLADVAGQTRTGQLRITPDGNLKWE